MRERILVGGSPGSGKSTGWLTIARMLPQHTFHVIDPDDGVLRVWKSEFPDVENINYYFTPTWYDKMTEYEVGHIGGVKECFEDLRKRVKPDDWIVPEMLGNLWSLAQSGFIGRVFKEDIDEYYIRARLELEQGAKRLEALKGWIDWNVINKMHNDAFMIPLCYQLPCHVYMTTSISITSPGEASREEAEQKAFYGDSLIRIDGQKHNIFRAQTILLFTRRRDGWYMSTFIKDRGRKFIENELIFDFATQYLLGAAGWSA